jgi:Tol biopolymer transport system component
MVALALVAAGVVADQASAATKKPTKPHPIVVAKVAASTVIVGKTTTVTAVVTKASSAAKQKVVLQRLVGKKWVTSSSKPLPTKGKTKKVSFTVRVLAPVAQKYRLHIAAKGKYAEGNSKTFTIKGVNPAPTTSSPANPGPIGPLASLVSHTTSSTTTAANGVTANNSVSISADGRYVAFSSTATNLVPNDTNGYEDVFRWDRTTDQIVMVSAANGVEGNAASDSPSISSDGSYVAFDSLASNLAPGTVDGFGKWDVMRWSAATGTSVYVSINNGTLGNDGSMSPSISADGTVVAFASAATNLDALANSGSEIFVWKQGTPTLARASIAWSDAAANGPSYDPAVSGDGGSVAFDSSATNISFLGTSDTNTKQDVFLWDRANPGTIAKRISAAVGVEFNGNSYYPSVNSDGTRVAFASNATNIPAGDTHLNGNVYVVAISGAANTFTWVSHGPANASPNGSSSYPSISADGNTVVYTSNATNLLGPSSNPGSRYDIYAWSVTTNASALVSHAVNNGAADGNSEYPTVSSDGKWIAFRSKATNLVSPALTGALVANAFVFGPRT